MLREECSAFLRLWLRPLTSVRTTQRSSQLLNFDSQGVNRSSQLLPITPVWPFGAASCSKWPIDSRSEQPAAPQRPRHGKSEQPAAPSRLSIANPSSQLLRTATPWQVRAASCSERPSERQPEQPAAVWGRVGGFSSAQLAEAELDAGFQRLKMSAIRSDSRGRGVLRRGSRGSTRRGRRMGLR